MLSSLLLLLACQGCQELTQSQELTRTFTCFDDYDRIDITLIDESTGAEQELIPSPAGVVDFGTLNFGHYAVDITAWSAAMDEPLIRLRRSFSVPIDRGEALLNLPSPGQLVRAVGSNKEFQRFVELELAFPCAETDWRWYHIANHPDSVYVTTTSTPFEGNTLALGRPNYEPFYLGLEAWTDQDGSGRSFSTRSEVIEVIPVEQNIVEFPFNVLFNFTIDAAEVRYFAVELPEDNLYRIDYFDRHNGDYEADQIVFFAQGGFGEARSAPPRGYGRIFNADAGLLDLKAAVAVPGTGGSSAVKVYPAVPDVVHDFSPQMTVALDEHNTLHHIRTQLDEGSYVFRITPAAFNPEMPVYAWLRAEHPLVNEGNSHFDFGRIGPEYNDDDRPHTRIFSITQAGYFDIYLLTGYNGSPTSCTLVLNDTVLN